MSREDVELVMSTLVPDGVDLVQLFGDAAIWDAQAEATAGCYHEDFECRMVRFDGEANYRGLEGFRDAWREWLAPWASYRVERHDVLDLEDQVWMPAYNLGRLHGSTEEIRMDGVAVFTFREGKIARLELYVDRTEAYADHAEALKAVGLEE